MTSTIKSKKRIRWALYIMLIPGIVLTLIYSYGPMMGLSIAFQKFDFTKGLFGSEWVGLKNFRYIFAMPDFKRALGNTLFIASLKIVLGLVFPIFVSIMLNEVRQTGYKRTIQTLIYLPHFVSWIIVAGIMQNLLSPGTGMVNAAIQALGFEPIYFLGDPKVFPFTMIVTDIWKGFGMGTILYLAAITGIDPSLYEAASIDGANRFQKMIHITLPGIVAIVVLNATLSMGGVLSAGFDQIFNMYSSVVYSTGDVIDTLVYRVGIQGVRGALPQYEIATAIGLFKSVVSAILIGTAYYLAHKFADYKIF